MLDEAENEVKTVYTVHYSSTVWKYTLVLFVFDDHHVLLDRQEFGVT